MLSIQTIQPDTLELLKHMSAFPKMFIDTPWDKMKKSITQAVKAYQK